MRHNYVKARGYSLSDDTYPSCASLSPLLCPCPDPPSSGFVYQPPPPPRPARWQMIALFNSWDTNGDGEGRGCYTCSRDAFGLGIEMLGPDPCLAQCAHYLHCRASTGQRRLCSWHRASSAAQTRHELEEPAWSA